MSRQKIITVTSLVALLVGCSGSNIAPGDMQGKHVEREEIVLIAQGVDPGLSDPDSVVVSVAVQILKDAYKRYKEAGGTEASFDKMPQGAFTDNLRSLYQDVKPLMER